MVVRLSVRLTGTTMLMVEAAAMAMAMAWYMEWFTDWVDGCY